MSVAADTAITRWAEIMEGKSTGKFLRASNVFVRDERVFSYGEHFELARPLRDKRKRVKAYLLNGDRYSQTTTQHQSSVRGALRKSSRPSVILPYTALDAAGVDYDSIELVHVLKDRSETRKHRTTVKPEGAVWFMEPIQESQPRNREEIEAALRRNGYGPNWNVDNAPDYLRTKRVTVGEKPVLYTNRFKRNHIAVTRDAEGRAVGFEWETYHHWLGESLIKARVWWYKLIPCDECGRKGTYPGLSESWDLACRGCNGRGAYLRRATRWTLFLSGFDHQEPNPLYFLCELPYHCRATTVEEAYEALKPVPVKLAEQMGRSYTRQGDIFAIPAPSMTEKRLREMGARIERRATVNSPRPTHLPYILGTNHTATEVAYLPGVTLARGLLYHDPSFREQDHVRRKMGDGKTWHVVVKNTVPTSNRR
jgi:hypothetical protein